MSADFLVFVIIVLLDTFVAKKMFQKVQSWATDIYKYRAAGIAVLIVRFAVDYLIGCCWGFNANSKSSIIPFLTGGYLMLIWIIAAVVRDIVFYILAGKGKLKSLEKS